MPACGRVRPLASPMTLEHRVDAVGDEPGAVERADLLRQPPRPHRPVRPRDLRDLVADRVEDDARVVDVLAHHRLDVALPPLREVERRVEVGLALGPHVGQLVHDEDAVPVAGVEHRPAHRVVRAAQRVEARLLQQLDAPLLGAADRRRAEDAVVGVDARAAELDRLAVDPQPTLGVERQGPDAEGDGVVVHLGVAVPQRRRSPSRAPASPGSTARARGAGAAAGRRPARRAARSPATVAVATTAPSPSADLGDDVERAPGRGRRARPSSRPRRRRTRSSTSVVVTRTPSRAMCVSGPTTRCTGRWMPAPEYQRESLCARQTTRISLSAPKQQVVVEVDGEAGVPGRPVAGEGAVHVDHRGAVDALELQQHPLVAVLLGRGAASSGTRRRRRGRSRRRRRARRRGRGRARRRAAA